MKSARVHTATSKLQIGTVFLSHSYGNCRPRDCRNKSLLNVRSMYAIMLNDDYFYFIGESPLNAEPFFFVFFVLMCIGRTHHPNERISSCIKRKILLHLCPMVRWRWWSDSANDRARARERSLSRHPAHRVTSLWLVAATNTPVPTTTKLNATKINMKTANIKIQKQKTKN